MQKTDLNVSPYYDDFSEASNFHRVLFRPAFSVQARELTQLQSILQNQIERMGSHFFKEGAMVIPGQAGIDLTFGFVKMQANFTDSGSVTHTLENYRTSLVGVRLTGATTNTIAKVVNTIAAEGSDELTLFIKYESSGTPAGGTSNFTFADGENLKTGTALSYVSGGTTYTFNINDPIGTTKTLSATGTGSAAVVQKGIYYIRGTFVQCEQQTLILDKYDNQPSYRIGFSVTESLVTPEEDTSLLDNATGSTNYAAKGAHRLKYTLTLAKKNLSSADDADFVELLTVENGIVQAKVRNTEYSVLEETLARRTFDESGNYIVRGFDIDMREHLDTGLNGGVFTAEKGGDASKVAITLSPGKAYVKGFEISTIGQTVVPLNKARETEFLQNHSTTFSAGNYLQVENVYGNPDIDSVGTSTIVPFREVELRDKRMPVTHINMGSNLADNGTSITVDSNAAFPQTGNFIVRIDDELILVTKGGNTTTFTVVGGASGRAQGGTTAAAHNNNAEVVAWGLDLEATVSANVIGFARTRAFEHGTGAEDSTFNAGTFSPKSARFHHYLFDVRMLCKLTLAGSVSVTGNTTASSANITNITTTNLKVGMGISGGSIPSGASISSITTAGTSNNGTIVISANASSTASGVSITATGNLSADKFVRNGAKITGKTSRATGFVYITKQDINTTSNTSPANSQADGTRLKAGGTIHLIQTTGTFVTGEQIESNLSEDLGGDAGSGGTTVLHATTAPIYHGMGDVHSVWSSGSQATYAANAYPVDALQLTGSVNVTAGSSTVNGTNTGFLSDLKVGDLIEVQDVGSGSSPVEAPKVRRFEVATIPSDTSFTTVETFPYNVTNSTILRVRSKLEEQEELVMISKLPKNAIKTLKAAQLNNQIDTTLDVRRQAIVTLQGGQGDLSLPEGESFVNFSLDDYQLIVHQEAGSSPEYKAGQVLAPSTDSSAACRLTVGTTSLTINLSNGDDAVLKVIFTVKIGTAQEKTKTLVPSETLAINNDQGNIYGTNYKDADISLNKADIFKVRAVFQSAADNTPAVAPTITYGNGSGGDTLSTEIFQKGEQITGSNGAIARVVNGGSTGATTTAQIVYLTEKVFTSGVTLTSAQNTFANTLTVSGVTTGDDNIISDFQIDDGQRDTFYDIGRLSRKATANAPTGNLLIVFDYFTHGAGNYFSVDSYPVGTSETSITYEEIPLYSATRVDPDTLAPSGEYDLRDSVDFRPRVADFAATNAYSSTVMSDTQLNAQSKSPFIFDNRKYNEGTSSLVDIPKTDATFQTSFDFYLPQNATLYLDPDGEFRTVLGSASEEPDDPSELVDAMKIAFFSIPQYTFDPLDINLRKFKNRRFTMRDIGKLEDRLSNVEYYTQLNLLEQNTESFQIQDGDGFDRFKNGFIVDNFTGHVTGDAGHPDYKNSMDMAQGILRPEYMSRVVELEEKATSDTERSAAGYQKTGDLLTLPYTERDMITQPYASRIENVNPFNVIAWVGSLELNPSSDIWKDTNRLPKLIINKEGTYDTLIAKNGGKAINTVWKEWELFWTGETTTTETIYDRGKYYAGKGRKVFTKTKTVKTGEKRREGVRTKITLRVDKESQGDKVVSTDILPFCRARNIKFAGTVFKPRTRVFAFFDNVDITQYITPDVLYVNKYTALASSIAQSAVMSSSSKGTVTVGSTATFDTSGSFQIGDEIFVYDGKTSTTFTGVVRAQSNTTAVTHSNDAVVYKTPVMGDPLITGATGSISGTFHLPDPNVSGNPAFPVGERTFRLTSDSENGALTGDTQTSGRTTYFAKGLLDNIREEIIATRNADVSETNVNESRDIKSTRERIEQTGWYDPVAQSIMIDDVGGVFVTSVDVYFQTKSDTVPVQCQIRTMNTGYPTTTILPFGQVTVQPSDVSISDDASVATKFTFPSPVFLQQNIEYCFVILANTQDYHIWLSHMGDVEVGGNRTISEQPYAGVLFKSQNASTWVASPMEDLKFIVRRASFSTSSGIVTLQNEALPSATLSTNPITTIKDSKKILVRHTNHGMYNPSKNNVTISGASGTLDGYNLSNINGTYTSLEEVGIDHYILNLAGVSTPPSSNFTKTLSGGGIVSATENYMMDVAKPVLQIMEVSGTNINTSVRTTSGTSPSGDSGVQGGSRASFNLTALTNAKSLTPNQDTNFETPRMVASPINETNEMSGNKSFETLLELETTSENLSPVIDMQRMGIITIQNRLNNINANTDLFSTGVLNADTVFSDSYKNSTSPEGDANAAIYCTRKIILETAATALKIIFDAVRGNDSSIEVYYKIQQADDTAQFDDLSWIQCSADKVVTESLNYTDFREYSYEKSGLNGYIAFAVKIVMKGTNTADPPFIKDFRAIALAL